MPLQLWMPLRKLPLPLPALEQSNLLPHHHPSFLSLSARLIGRFISIISSSTRSSSTSVSVLPSSTITVTTQPDADLNRMTPNDTNINIDTDNKPQPVIDALSFIPRPIFASA